MCGIAGYVPDAGILWSSAITCWLRLSTEGPTRNAPNTIHQAA